MTYGTPGDYDIYLFCEGNHFRSYEMLGAHLVEQDGVKGVNFTVWAPRAREVRVSGDFNRWQAHQHPMEKIKGSGIWSIFVPGLKEGARYKYEIYTDRGEVLLKSDPYAFCSEVRSRTASIVYALDGYEWQDESWQQQKSEPYQRPMLIYEVHPGSWRRNKDGKFYSYRQLAEELVEYAAGMGYTHIELLPLAEHPLDISWGYQATGYYSVTSRYGTPHDFMYFVDCCHRKGIGVIMDWVPGHFCRDGHGLMRFDGTPTYEYEDSLKSENREWDTINFDLGRPEVQSFLISNALFWMEVYHIDGLRVDAVSMMLYLNFCRDQGEWSPNMYGGNENLEAITFLRKLNETVFKYYPKVLMIAEESTEWPMVSAPTYLGGLGFNFKWNMGWMNDTLRYMEKDTVCRKWHHNLLTFSMWYIYAENFILPLSHDEVVHGKKSLLGRMPGDYWQQFANLRLLFGYMMTHPGKKLVFMGGELGQFNEWNVQTELDWNLLDYDMHERFQSYVRKLNHFYLEESSLWELDHEREGFQWINSSDYSQSVIAFIRKDAGRRFTVVVCSFTPAVHNHYRVGVPQPGSYREVFNSDSEEYGGSGQVNGSILQTSGINWYNQPYSLVVKVPPLALIIIKLQ